MYKKTFKRPIDFTLSLFGFLVISPIFLKVTVLLYFANNGKPFFFQLRPGITGWAQVNGRNAISWKQKFEYDVWYVDNVLFTLDIKIIGLPLLKVLKRDGINAENSATAEKFTGNN